MCTKQPRGHFPTASEFPTDFFSAEVKDVITNYERRQREKVFLKPTIADERDEDGLYPVSLADRSILKASGTGRKSRFRVQGGEKIYCHIKKMKRKNEKRPSRKF